MAPMFFSYVPGAGRCVVPYFDGPLDSGARSGEFVKQDEATAEVYMFKSDVVATGNYDKLLYSHFFMATVCFY